MAEPTHNHTRWRNGNDPWSPCPPSCPARPGEDVRAEVREQIARWLYLTYNYGDGWAWDNLGVDHHFRRGAYRAADALIAAVPAVAEALAAVEKVRAVVAFVDECADSSSPARAGVYRDIARRLRRALGEDGR